MTHSSTKGKPTHETRSRDEMPRLIWWSLVAYCHAWLAQPFRLRQSGLKWVSRPRMSKLPELCSPGRISFLGLINMLIPGMPRPSNRIIKTLPNPPGVSIVTARDRTLRSSSLDKSIPPHTNSSDTSQQHGEPPITTDSHG